MLESACLRNITAANGNREYECDAKISVSSRRGQHMLWLIAFHVIFVVCWFAGLFYLPRLYVYHAQATDSLSIARFKIMERRLLFGIMTPAGILATLFGLTLLLMNTTYYLHQGWMDWKLVLVGLLWIYHIMSAKYYFDFKADRNRHTHIFYRYFNEGATFFLFAIVILAIVRP